MRADPNHKYELKTREKEQIKARFHEQKVGRRRENAPILTFSFAALYQRIIAGLQRLQVSVKYRFYQVTAGIFEKFSFPWFKLGLAALAIFIVLKKDIHFSVNMQAPLGEAADDRSDERIRTSEMSLVKTVSVAGMAPDASSGLPAVDDLDEQRVKAYIKRFSKVAAAEMEKFGIPASIKMAQGILESRAGEHPEARQANNHFGAPMSGSVFDSAWENWRAHSLLITEKYANEEWGANYKSWARGLEQTGYHPSANYAETLLEMIDTYQLYQLDEW